jgi:hypothetical protein
MPDQPLDDRRPALDGGGRRGGRIFALEARGPPPFAVEDRGIDPRPGALDLRQLLEVADARDRGSSVRSENLISLLPTDPFSRSGTRFLNR